MFSFQGKAFYTVSVPGVHTPTTYYTGNTCSQSACCIWDTKLAAFSLPAKKNPTNVNDGTSPELRIIAVDGDCLRSVERVFQHKFHVLSRAEAGKKLMRGGDGVAKHVANALSLVQILKEGGLGRFFGQNNFFIPILKSKQQL